MSERRWILVIDLASMHHESVLLGTEAWRRVNFSMLERGRLRPTLRHAGRISRADLYARENWFAVGPAGAEIVAPVDEALISRPVAANRRAAHLV